MRYNNYFYILYAVIYLVLNHSLSFVQSIYDKNDVVLTALV